MIPTIRLDKDFISILVAILGTTISPYLFFWQATMEAEDIQAINKQVMVNKRMLIQNHPKEEAKELVKAHLCVLKHNHQTIQS